MANPFTTNIVRIQNAAGMTVGAGFLAGPAHILTCAHVVRQALGLPRNHTDRPTDLVHVDFPLLPDRPALTARVTLWQPAADITGLTPNEPLPETAVPVNSTAAFDIDLWEHRFRSFGFPQGRSGGVYARGVILGPQADGWLHVEATTETGYTVQPGFSGAPVWDESLKAVAGMITVADTEPGVRAAFIIPTATLKAAWPAAFDDTSISPPSLLPVADPIQQLLRRQLAGGHVTLFVGSGLAEAAGLPGKSALFRPLGEAIGQPLPPDEYVTADHLLNTAQLYGSAMGRNALISHLLDELDTTFTEPSICHRTIADLPVNTIFSTAYDDLLERALRDAHRRANVIVRDTSLTLSSPNRVQLIKLRGDLRQLDTLVVTRQQHNEYAVRHPLLTRELQTHLVNSTFLFVGFDLADPDFNLAFDPIAYQVGDAQRLSYAALFNVPTLKREELRSRHIQVINLETNGQPDKWNLLARWLHSLTQEQLP